MPNKSQMVIFDIDGTLADNDHRVHYLKSVKKDWDGFFAAQDKDLVREDVLTVLNMYLAQSPETLHVALLTGRGEEWRPVTEKWLEWNEIEYSSLTMRPLGDRTDDDILKLDQIKAWQAEGWHIIGLFDDRMRICEAARNHGITVFQMARGEF